MLPMFWLHTLTRPFQPPAPAWELNLADAAPAASLTTGNDKGHLFIVVLDAFPTRVALDDGAPR